VCFSLNKKIIGKNIKKIWQNQKKSVILQSEKIEYNVNKFINKTMELLKVVEEQYALKREWPEFNSGDTVTVSYKIKEGNKERVQQFKGVVIQKKGMGISATFTVRKMSGSTGVERIFPVESPFISSVEVNKRGSVRRARIFYVRELTGKKARIKEKRM
jgi:large subunit ribosomal protein L19